MIAARLGLGLGIFAVSIEVEPWPLGPDAAPGGYFVAAEDAGHTDENFTMRTGQPE